MGGVIEIQGHQLFCVDSGGPGPALLMVHGSPISSHGFRHQIEAMAGQYRVLAPDLLCFGRSGGSDRGASFEDQADALGRLLRHPSLGLDPARPLSMAVHDWGGPVALGALALWDDAARHGGCPPPPRLERLMLINTGCDPDFSPPWYWLLRSPVVGGLVIERLNAVSWGLRLLMNAASSAEVRSSYAAPLRRRSTRRAVARLEQLDGYRPLMLKAHEARRCWAEARSMYFRGEPEPYFSDRDVEHCRAVIPHLEVQREPGAGHFPMEDAPATLTAAMVSFFG